MLILFLAALASPFAGHCHPADIPDATNVTLEELSEVMQLGFVCNLLCLLL